MYIYSTYHSNKLDNSAIIGGLNANVDIFSNVEILTSFYVCYVACHVTKVSVNVLPIEFVITIDRSNL